MAKAPRTAIEPTREQDYPEWYQQVVKAADLAQNAPVRGCMVIRPWGYALWENMQRVLDAKFKATGHVNAYFPLFIPISYLQKEAEHVEGFAKECAVVTHHRLEMGPEGKLVPAGELEEPLIVRPTSETIIGEMYAKWVQSYRDLPILINQWANVVRWEMRPRIFLRTAEFLWQEGHTAHATEGEAREETLRMLDVYCDFATNYMAIPVIKGEKSATQRFPGAVATYTFEPMMQNRWSLQAGTSHFLGQNFAKAAGIKYLSAEGKEEFAWTTSWGVSTRMIGGIVMAHGDDDGLVLPPRLAPAHVVVLPVLHKEESRAQVLEYCESLVKELREVTYDGRPLQVEFDTRDLQGGEKVWSWIKKGIPMWLEVGPRDVENGAVFAGRRDKGKKGSAPQSRAEFVATVAQQLAEMQQALYDRALAFRDANIRRIDSKDEFYAFFTPKNKEKPEIHGGFALSHWCGDPAVEEMISQDLQVTIRVIPFEGELPGTHEPGVCPFTGKPSAQRVVWARAY
jgi:prolyl-tRNA synthetase